MNKTFRCVACENDIPEKERNYVDLDWCEPCCKAADKLLTVAGTVSNVFGDSQKMFSRPPMYVFPELWSDDEVEAFYKERRK